MADAALAPQACSSCRKQKRKCDKALPSCALCIRIGRSCDYSAEAAPPPSPEDFAALRQKVTDLEALLSSPAGCHGSTTNGSNGQSSNGSTGSSPGHLLGPGSAALVSPGTLGGSPNAWPGPASFPTLFFLDSDDFMYERFTIEKPHVAVPPGALQPLGGAAELREMVELYFVSVHTYMPIVSKVRLYQFLANPLLEPGADIALLFLCMKLAATPISEDSLPLTPLYQRIKSLYANIEAQNGFSLQLIQGLMLIALYEIGHAIYPAAYLTIGHCARLGHAMGLHDSKDAPQMLPKCRTWTEQEERRRVWWGVLILDRFVNIGNRSKPFATEDPSMDMHLPVDDAHWDCGQMLVAAPLALSASTTIRAAVFARACQASYLLGKNIRHMNDRRMPLEFRFDEALQLHRTLRALASLLPQEAEDDDPLHKPTMCTSLAICYSALLMLYDSYSCTDSAVEGASETHLQMQKQAIEGLSETSATVVQLARRIRGFVDRAGLEKLSPLVVDCLYRAAANYAWYIRESSDAACRERLVELKELLGILNQRWRVAGEYLRITEATESHLASATR